MKRLYHFYARELGERPILVLVFLLLISGFLYYHLVCFVWMAPRGVFGLNQDWSAFLMGTLIALVCGVLLWRLTVADQTLRKMVFGKYRKAIDLVDSKAKATIRDLAGRLGMKKSFFKKLLRLITLTPEPFIALILFLTASIALLYILFLTPEYFHLTKESVGESVYVNCPWAFATIISIYVIYNDIKVMESLRHLVDSIPVTEFADFYEHLEKFRNQLTNTEREVLKYFILYAHLSNREISELVNLSEDTIKTHKHNIRVKWRQYATEYTIVIPLEKLLTAFYSD